MGKNWPTGTKMSWSCSWKYETPQLTTPKWSCKTPTRALALVILLENFAIRNNAKNYECNIVKSTWIKNLRQYTKYCIPYRYLSKYKIKDYVTYFWQLRKFESKISTVSPILIKVCLYATQGNTIRRTLMPEIFSWNFSRTEHSVLSFCFACLSSWLSPYISFRKNPLETTNLR